METLIKGWSIDDAKPEDTESLAIMHAQSWKDTYVDIQPGITAKWVEDRVAKQLSSEGLDRRRSYITEALNDPEKKYYKVAYDDSGDVIGCVTAHKDSDSQRIDAFYVAKKYHGRGVSRELANQLLDWLDSSKATYLGVAVNNERAIHFYEELGFGIVPDSEHDFGGGLIEITMTRPAQEVA